MYNNNKEINTQIQNNKREQILLLKIKKQSFNYFLIRAVINLVLKTIQKL